MTKIVINVDYGGPRWPEVLEEFIARRKGWRIQGSYWARPDAPDLNFDDIPRDDPDLVTFLELLGDNESLRDLFDLVVVEIPDGVAWQIDDYDGKEWVAERHRRWGEEWH